MTFRDYAQRVRSELELEGVQVVVLRDVDSTNAFGRRLIRAVAEDAPTLRPTVVLAWRQSAGRGRLGRRWESARGCGIYLTAVLPPRSVERTELELLPLIVGVACCRALRRIVPEVELKWPNDLVVERKKLGGVLIESVALGAVDRAAIVGVGVNHGQLEGELPVAGATSLAIETAKRRRKLPEMATVAAGLAESLLLGIEGPLDRDAVLGAYRELTAHRPGERLRCRIQNRVVEGEFRGFDDEGHLLLRRDGQEETETWYAGEVIEDFGE